jgi:hypothetical protein
MNHYRFLAMLACALTLIQSVSAHAFRDFQVVGQGDMRWFFMSLYEAKLLSQNGGYAADQLPVVLELTYKKNISKSNLLQATKSEWQRMGVAYDKSWLVRLETIWPNVSTGDVLTLYINDSGISEFYFNEHTIGTMPDRKFGTAFLSIWLSRKSGNQHLREQLLGITAGK